MLPTPAFYIFFVGLLKLKKYQLSIRKILCVTLDYKKNWNVEVFRELLNV